MKRADSGIGDTLLRSGRRIGGKAAALISAGGEKALATTVTIAVTGLARAGKTVFTTALAHNLSRAAELPDLLPFFSAAKERQILGAALSNRGPEAFPFDAAMKALTGNPADWPRPTTDVSDLSIAVDYATRSKRWRMIAPKTFLTLNIVDYPGEWLLDLLLLNTSFTDWSRETLQLCRQPPRATLAQDWLTALEAADGNRPAAEEDLERLAGLYTAFLRRCSEAGLSFLQPGRFLVPGSLADRTMLEFCPFPVSDAGKPWRGSLAAALEARYERYRREVVRPFYRRYFSRFTRQVVLVDLLTALDRGSEGWSDLQLALTRIVDNFHTERKRVINRLPLIGTRTDKLLFACTKADHITRNNHSNLRALLRSTVEPSAVMVMEGGATVGYEIVSAVKSTKNVQKRQDGRTLHYIRGVPLGSTVAQDWDPGDIPDEPPRAENWPEIRITGFRPPQSFDASVAGFRSINLDRALEFLIGDLFK
ncbi:MAG TPA: YcjX family protein [Alphaproteobacteria bacterium]|nr:YcjX family protein [Alphaproteobacteria bacterium]